MSLRAEVADRCVRSRSMKTPRELNLTEFIKTILSMKLKAFCGYVLYHLIVLALLIHPVNSYGSSALEKHPLAKGLDTELAYLLSFVGPKAVDPDSFSADRISALLEFVAKPKDDGVLYHAAEINGASSAYNEIDIARSLEEILRLTYNPDIPSVITMPSTLRLSHWKEIESTNHTLPKLWERLPNLASPLLVTGIEHIVNSPDYSSGAYFEYDLYRTLILMKHSGRSVLISLSKQRDKSDVGKKGIVIGPDENWDYIYTDIPGVNKSGFGWVKSYMYDSYSVSFYSEMEAGGSRVRYGVFKWVSAGFAGINLARSIHIHNGMVRFSSGFKQILENPRTADTPAIAKAWKTVENLPEQKLRQITEDHLSELEERCATNGLMADKQVAALFVDQQYLNTFDREEMQVLIMLEHLKQILNDAKNPTLSYLPAYQKLTN